MEALTPVSTCTNAAACEVEPEEKQPPPVVSPSDSYHPKCEMADRCVEDCAAYGRVCPFAARAAGIAACVAIAKLKENSVIFGNDEPIIYKIKSDDLIMGEKLGEGGFSLVNACTLKSDPTRQIAIKYLKRQVMVNQRQFEHGAADLVQEAYFLSVLDHPHIIKLHGATAGNVQSNVETGKECCVFITIDRLRDTLEQRLQRWREEEEEKNHHHIHMPSIFAHLSHEYKECKQSQLRERLLIALHIAQAVKYLHDKNIIFRDLKPDNVGFDSQGVLKLFDFGLAKELKPGEGNPDGRYQLTGNTGSRRYMAPEVAKEMPYNKSVDSYSFGIMLHEILSVEKPFQGYSNGKHMSLVVIGGERPSMDSRHTSFWPMNLQWLMKRCWSPVPTNRPDFDSIVQTLQDVINSNGPHNSIPLRVSHAQQQQQQQPQPDPSSGCCSSTQTTTLVGSPSTNNPSKLLQPLKRPEIEAPAGGFSSLLLGRRKLSAKSHGSNGESRSQSPVDTAEIHGKSRGISLGWVFRSHKPQGSA